MDSKQEAALETQINTLVRMGNQGSLIDLFPADDAGVRNIPNRIGQWSMRHYKSLKPVSGCSESVVALPITVNARQIYEAGCIETLKREGYSEENAQQYLAAAQGVSYAWLPVVIAAVKQMLRLEDVGLTVIKTLKASENPRKTAVDMKMPQRPFKLSHYQFLSMLEIAEKILSAQAKAAHAEMAQELLESSGLVR